MGKLAPARVSYPDDFVISYRVYMMTGFFHHSTSNVLKLTKPSWIDKNYACATRSSLPVVYLQTDFTPKRVVVSRLHDTVAKARTGVEFSPRCENRGELALGRLAPGRHDILWWYHVNKCRALRGNRSELAPARKSPRCHVNTPFKLNLTKPHTDYLKRGLGHTGALLWNSLPESIRAIRSIG